MYDEDINDANIIFINAVCITVSSPRILTVNVRLTEYTKSDNLKAVHLIFS